jgi:6-pyruvoyltetrahydropterin 2'-reductase|tara:strand:+ start:1212 stop:2102 length:891 start_codon:yes stop_codon:yes gene_type:complete
MKEYHYSEIFHSAQGEGMHTGVPGPWLRYFLCNLQCNGFGQIDPTDPDTYQLPYEQLDTSKYEKLEDLPVFDLGCDSSYSWAKKYKKFAHKATPREITNRIYNSMKNKHNPIGLFKHPSVGAYWQHLHITGGEPLMPHAQECTIQIMQHMVTDLNFPQSITFETNGTQELTPEFEGHLRLSNRVHWSVSPKLYTVSGEHAHKAFKPEIIKSYQDVSKHGMLKFVCNGRPEAWDEIEQNVDMLRRRGVEFPVSIMPVGATVEGQKLVDGQVASEAVARGYHISARVHTYLWGNVIGV